MTKPRAAAWVLLMVLLAAVLAGAQDRSAELRIDWAKFKKAYDAESVAVVDVRSADAFEAGHIPRAMSVPLDDVERRAGELKKLAKPVVLYCS